MIIKIANKSICPGKFCFIIAEAGVNHNGRLDLALKMIDVAKKCGADAVKFQTFKPGKLVTINAKQAKYQSKNIGKKESQYKMLKKLELSYSDFQKIKKYCGKKKIIFLSTPHSCKEDVDLVAKLCPAIKVGSGDLTILPILKYMAKKQLPIILSTGMATLKEVKEAVKSILPINKKLILLHCVTNYPTQLKNVNLRVMTTMRKKFNIPVGYSDHTEGIKVSLAASAMGACVIEKHFTLNKNLPGPDHEASLEPQELRKMIEEIRKIEERIKEGERPEKIIKKLNISKALGNGIKKINPSEAAVAKVVRKSIVAAINIKKGKKIKENELVIKRPGTGINPKFINKIIGKKAKKDIKEDEVITWEKI